MAQSPRYKIYSPTGEYVACCKYPEDAAAIVASYGEGAQIRDGHKRVVFEEGKWPLASAGESYDIVASVVAGTMCPACLRDITTGYSNNGLCVTCAEPALNPEFVA